MTRPVPPEYADWTPDPTPCGLVYVSPDGMQAYSPTRNRVYKRKFDRATARALYAEGVSAHEIGRRLGATEQAVILAVMGVEYQAAYYARANAYQMNGVCELCGGQCVSQAHRRRDDGRTLCRVCSSVVRRTAIRYDVDGIMVRCTSCKEWFPGDTYGYGGRYRDVRDGGYSQACRACHTAARSDYRNRHRVPCEGGCGTMVEGRGRVNKDGQDPDRPYLCLSCWHARRRAAAAS